MSNSGPQNSSIDDGLNVIRITLTGRGHLRPIDRREPHGYRDDYFHSSDLGEEGGRSPKGAGDAFDHGSHDGPSYDGDSYDNFDAGLNAAGVEEKVETDGETQENIDEAPVARSDDLSVVDLEAEEDDGCYEPTAFNLNELEDQVLDTLS